MANLEFLDSNVHYVTNKKYRKYENPGGSMIVAGDGRFGVPSITATLFAGGPYITFKRNLTEVYTGAAFKLAANGWGGVLALGNNGQQFLFITIRNDGRVELFNRTIQSLGVSLTTFDLNTWYYLELGGIITPHVGGTGGTLEYFVRLNEVELIHGTTSGDTEYNAAVTVSGGEYFTQAFRFVNAPNAGWSSDFYVHTDRFLGDIKVRAIFPDGPGTFNDWTVNGAATAWQATNEASPDDNTSYISSHTPDDPDLMTTGDKTSVNMQDVDLEDGECLGIQFLACVKKDDANVRKIKVFTLQDGVEGEGDEFSMPTDYVYTHDCQDVNPATDAPWTEAELNDVELGVHLTA